jgi:hypothetical protein
MASGRRSALRVVEAWVWRSVLVTLTLASSGCQDWTVRRTSAGAVADTGPNPAEQPAAPAARRSRKDAGRGKAGVGEESFARVRRELRRLATAEEIFFAENGTYSEDLPSIGFKLDSTVKIRFLWLSREGWAASGTHPSLEGKDCVIFVGQSQSPPTTLKYLRQGREGVPVCDDSRRAPEPVAVAPPPKPKPQASSDTVSVLDALNPRIGMMVDLRNLAHSQQTYFGTQGIYAKRTEPLALQYLWHRDVRVKILAADGESWAAKATHARLPGKSCVIWFGPVVQRPATDAQRRRGDRSGVPVCDE